MRTESEIKQRIEELEKVYDRQDPPTSQLEDEQETVLLRAIAELEWVIGERREPPELTE